MGSSEFEVSAVRGGGPPRMVIRFISGGGASVISVPEDNAEDVIDAMVKVRAALAADRQSVLSVKWT